MFAFLYVNATSKEICDKISFLLVFRKMLMPAFLLRFKANYVKNMRSYPKFSNIYFFRLVLCFHDISVLFDFGVEISTAQTGRATSIGRETPLKLFGATLIQRFTPIITVRLLQYCNFMTCQSCQGPQHLFLLAASLASGSGGLLSGVTVLFT